ncbi:MAG: phenylalanine--tRNA ligase subunit alpha, partial [Proteobacteria bacterium]|nr:phenylalanine--tRNA ligase subunit alpha [Pseudomonadota bacterium]
MEQEILKLQGQAEEQLATVENGEQLEEFRIRFLGRKGQFGSLMKELANVPVEDKPRLGQMANKAKKEIEGLYTEKQQKFAEGSTRATGKSGQIDLTLPGRRPQNGKLHPVTQIMNEVCAIFESLGFSVAEGPDVEHDHYNFEALNIPAHHPARDMHDTFYVSDSILLRTHTSPMQARIMEKQQPPLRVIAPGKVYRCDSDITHTPMFHQVEGFLVDKHVSFADLKGVLTTFTQKM